MDLPSLRFYSTYEELKLVKHYHEWSNHSLFLQYLWGIETNNALQVRWCDIQFLQYLWGIETINSDFIKYSFL